MARVKVDWSKVTMSGPVGAANLIPTLVEVIRNLVISGAIKTKIAKVTLNVGEGESAKQYGAEYLKIDSATDEAVDSILAAIKLSGKAVVIESWNGIQRDSKLAYLAGAFGDVSKAIEDATDVLVEKMGMDRDEARAFAIAQRVKNGMRVS